MEMEIPYTVHERPDTGLYNGKLGIWLFLASEVMLFGSLFSALVMLRTGAASWPHGYEILNIPLATLNTFVLIASSVTVVLAWASLRLGDFAKGKLYLIATLGCGGIFMIIKAIEYGTKFSHGQFPRTNNFFATYYTLTGLHGLHVVGGMLVFAWLIWPGAKMWLHERQRYINRVETTGLYWHFVDLVWIFLFPTLYLL
ncbi:MAG TPA: cytochrome c oxidase subunit 3 [Thermoanaerobaculia bacterium]|nr:cytochrome c oxidase subunit 3 [Thermoanaerobaculia bacterium]